MNETLTNEAARLDAELLGKIGMIDGQSWIMLRQRVVVNGRVMGAALPYFVHAVTTLDGQPVNTELHGGFSSADAAEDAARILAENFDDYTSIAVVKLTDLTVLRIVKGT